MTTVYIIRHAEAEGNLYRRIHGQYDSLVTERGARQIAELESRFRGEEIGAVYSSDLTRARVTAAAICKPKGLALRTSPLLREVDMGVWEDKTWGEVEYFEPDVLYAFNNSPANWHVAGSEDYYALQARMTAAITGIAEENDERAVAVVTHGSALRAFLAGILGVRPEEIQKVPHCDNTAVAKLTFESGAFTAVFFGDNAHLSAENSTFAHQKWWRENATFDSTNMRFVPFDFRSGEGRYIESRRGAYFDVFGDDGGFSAQACLASAKERAKMHEFAISQALIGDTPSGLLELDILRDSGEKAGYIAFYGVEKAFRRTGVAVQLLGQAVSVYRSLGREKLRLDVEPENETALRFFMKYGFVVTGRSALGDKLALEKRISLGDWAMK